MGAIFAVPMTGKHGLIASNSTSGGPYLKSDLHLDRWWLEMQDTDGPASGLDPEYNQVSSLSAVLLCVICELVEMLLC